MNTVRDRITGLDVYRITAVFFVFLFHSNMNFNCNYGRGTKYISMGAIYMTAFFLLSGFALFHTWHKKNLTIISIIKQFYIKRLIGIMPLYYAVAIIHTLFIDKEALIQKVIIAPIEILGLQTVFTSLFGVAHNGGTWFVSCILLCYLAYPFIQEIAKQASIKSRMTMIALAFFVLLYSPIVVRVFNTSGIYSNPFFRILEFSIGVFLCSLMPAIKNNSFYNNLFTWKAVIIESVILFAGVTLAVMLNIAVGDYMLYSWVALPMFMLQLISMAGLTFPERLNGSKVLSYFSEISYAFFFAQLFCWGAAGKIIEMIGYDNNTIRITVSLFICFAYAIVLHEVIEKPIKSEIIKHL